MNSSMKCRDLLPIPIDLVIEIFSRLPRKSIARCSCLSKFWAYVIQSQYFIDLWETNSFARPQILLAHTNKGGFSFFSAYQPQQDDENLSDIALNHLTDGPSSYKVGVPINGLLCLSSKFPERSSPTGYASPISVIYNPSTGEFLNLPKTKKTTWEGYSMRSYLGYDPTEKQFKVLSLTLPGIFDVKWKTTELDLVEYQVLTLETGELSWRKIECFQPHLPIGREICINGILYYRAFSMEYLLVCFDVRSETFRFIKAMETFKKKQSWTPINPILTNYDGKLGLLMMNEGETSLELLVLNDVEKNEWLKHVYILPPIWKDIAGNSFIVILGMISINEIVLYQHCGYTTPDYDVYVKLPPYIFYYNTEKSTIRRVKIKGRNSSRHKKVYMFLNHVEKASLFKPLSILD